LDESIFTWNWSEKKFIFIFWGFALALIVQ
jgi:hypothetical protein